MFLSVIITIRQGIRKVPCTITFNDICHIVTERKNY